MSSIHSSQVDLNLLRVFQRIYIERSVSVAAQRLGLTQSAVSHGLRKLRLLFKDELFLRVGASMVPTPRAEALYEPVQRMMDTFAAEVLPVARFDAASARREFRLAMIDMAELVFLPGLMRYLKQHAPHCRITTRRIAYENIVDALESGVVEMAVGTVPRAKANIYRQTMFTHDFVVLASRRHPRLKSRLTWSAFTREEHIVVDSGADANLRQFVLEPMSIKRKVYLTLDGYLSVPWLLRDSELIATVPTRLSEEMAEMAQIRQFKLPDPARSYPLQSAWHPRWQNDPGHRWLRESLFDLMHDYPRVG